MRGCRDPPENEHNKTKVTLLHKGLRKGAGRSTLEYEHGGHRCPRAGLERSHEAQDRHGGGAQVVEQVGVRTNINNAKHSSDDAGNRGDAGAYRAVGCSVGETRWGAAY